MKNTYDIAKHLIAEGLYHVGVRTLAADEIATLEIGSACRKSYDWDLSTDTTTYPDCQATGTRCTAIDTTMIDFYDGASDDPDNVRTLASQLSDAIAYNRRYTGDVQVIIAGLGDDTINHAVDERESVLTSAWVVAIVRHKDFAIGL